MKLYIVTMYRWGNRENHSYVLGVFDNEENAIRIGKEHGVYRGGKYEPEVIEMEVNNVRMDFTDTSKVVLSIDGDKS